MARIFIGFGSGKDGDVALSGTDSVEEATFSGSSGGTSGTTQTGKSFAANDLVLIIQMRGINAGKREINQIATYTSGTGAITFHHPLENTYAHGGSADKAKIYLLKEYRNVTISSTFTCREWDASTGLGGVFAWLANGKTYIDAAVNGEAKGYAGGVAPSNFGNGSNAAGSQGEGSSGAGSQNNTAANGNGGGGASRTGSNGGGASGGGGANSTTASDGGTFPGGGSNPGLGGVEVGTAEMTDMFMGGGGGSAASDTNNGFGGAGGDGGAIGMVHTAQFEVTTSGSINMNGANGQNGGAFSGGGAGGAGGSLEVITRSAVYNSNRITSVGGTGGSGASGGGANGTTGRIRIKTCTDSGTTNPSANVSAGGHSFCASGYSIL